MDKRAAGKLSEHLKARLASLAPDETRTAIVLAKKECGKGERLGTAERMSRAKPARAAAARLRDSVREEFPQPGQLRVLDQDLGLFGGVAVVATRGALERLAQRDDVEAILEDQKVEWGKHD